MSLFKKIFGNKQKDDTQETAGERGRYMPELNLPVDEKFTINFKKNGGKFLYCDSIAEVEESFQNILDENTWNGHNACCLDDNLKQKFESFEVSFTKNCQQATFLITLCENLVADDGSILISSNQIGEKKLKDLPDNFIVYATTSQMVNTIGEGLRGIKAKNQNQIPTNITTIKHFDIKEEKDFLSYGSSSKNLYLLLLEDL